MGCDCEGKCKCLKVYDRSVFIPFGIVPIDRSLSVVSFLVLFVGFRSSDYESLRLVVVIYEYSS